MYITDVIVMITVAMRHDTWHVHLHDQLRSYRGWIYMECMIMYLLGIHASSGVDIPSSNQAV